MQELKMQEKEKKQSAVERNKRKAEEIRKAAMEGRASESSYLFPKHTIQFILPNMVSIFNLMVGLYCNNFSKQ